MFRSDFRMLAALIVLCLGGHVNARTTATDQPFAKRPATVADSIGMVQIGDRGYLDDFTRNGNVVQFSSDGSRFAFVVQKGNLQNDTVEFRLLVFKTADALTRAQPKVIATLAASSNREAISHVKWLPDNDTLVFIGEQPGEVPQLYRAIASTGQLEKLTNSLTPVVAYSMSDRGDAFIYMAEVANHANITASMRAHGFVVASETWEELYGAGKADFDPRKEIFVKTPSLKAPASLGVRDFYPDQEGIDLKLSPDGRYALVNAYVTAAPAAWDDYSRFKALRSGFAAPSNCTPGHENSICPMQYLLIDLENESISPLLDAPLMIDSAGSEAFGWTGENSILLVNAYLPLGSVNGEERDRRTRDVYAAEVALPGRQIRTIAERETPFDADSILAGSKRDRFIIQSVWGSGSPVEFRKQAGKWTWVKQKPDAMQAGRGLSVTLDQGPNTPPRLVAHDPKSKREAIVLNLNPQFAKIDFGHVETFHWTTRSGFQQEGLLYYPVGYIAGRKYPVVLQTHGSIRDRFWIDGPFTTGFSAQALAGRGFLVLQMPMGDMYNEASLKEVTKILGTTEEGPYFTDMIESAIDALDRRALIDQSRVGMTGFSRTVYQVLYALTHSNYHFGAAIVADGADLGYANCIFAPDFQSVCEKMDGGMPYGATLANWAKAAPTFRLDKVEAPLLLQAISAPISEFEILSGLRWLKKPVEMENFYPEGTHVLVRPRQRLLSQGSAVDWFSYWLQGYEDPDAAKAEQYARWEKLCDLQRQQVPRNPSYCVPSRVPTSPALTSGSEAAISPKTQSSN